MRRTLTGALATCMALASVPELALAQDTRPVGRLLNLNFSAGASAERYSGNLSSVTAVVVDSTERAGAAIGEFGVNAGYEFRWDAGRVVTIAGDAGLRQFAASGFDLRDYSPRELVGRITTAWAEPLGEGARYGYLDIVGQYRARGIADRPPMPLFLQPGYAAFIGEVRWLLPPGERARFDLSVSGAHWNYSATAFAPQLDLLDKRELGIGGGVRLGAETPVRLTLGYRGTRYPDQRTFDDEDPVRRDRTTQAGVSAEFRSSAALLQVGILGSLNRSNSRRPEYDAVAVDAAVTVPLDWQQVDVTLSSSITGKRYLTETEFARLVPGEEADNASVVFLTVSRPLMPQITGSFRLGWTRAETDIGDEYYQRWGLGFFLDYRPW